MAEIKEGDLVFAVSDGYPVSTVLCVILLCGPVSDGVSNSTSTRFLDVPGRLVLRISWIRRDALLHSVQHWPAAVRGTRMSKGEKQYKVRYLGDREFE